MDSKILPNARDASYANSVAKLKKLLAETNERLVGGENDTQPAKLLCSLVIGLLNDLYVIRRELAGERSPQVGDSIRGTLNVERGDAFLLAFLYGEVVCIAGLASVRMSFNDYEIMDGFDEEWDSELARYLNCDLNSHASRMQWDERHAEWGMDL
jgi:hypothetical protein